LVYLLDAVVRFGGIVWKLIAFFQGETL